MPLWAASASAGSRQAHLIGDRPRARQRREDAGEAQRVVDLVGKSERPVATILAPCRRASRARSGHRLARHRGWRPRPSCHPFGRIAPGPGCSGRCRHPRRPTPRGYCRSVPGVRDLAQRHLSTFAAHEDVLPLIVQDARLSTTRHWVDARLKQMWVIATFAADPRKTIPPLIGLPTILRALYQPSRMRCPAGRRARSESRSSKVSGCGALGCDSPRLTPNAGCSNWTVWMISPGSLVSSMIGTASTPPPTEEQRLPSMTGRPA